MPFRWKKVMDTDMAQRKENIESSFQNESEPQFGFQTLWSTDREAEKSDAELVCFVLDRWVPNTSG